MKALSHFICLFLIYSSIFIVGAAGQTYTVSPTGGQSDQNIINEAINKASSDGGGTVYLSAGTYFVDGTIIIKSNIELTGDSNAIVQVSDSSSQWFTGNTGIISCQESLKNVVIHGFQINGNCINLPESYADTPGHDHDCERCILIGGYSNDYAENIQIYNMKLYDSFSDGIYIRYAKNVNCYSNFISNCQHEGIFWSVVLESVMSGNNIAGITSDCARLDNCVKCVVFNNIFFSYSGDHNNGAYEHGENGLQVGDAGSSHGYDASNKPTTTTDIEIYNNTFANNGLKAILLGSNSDNNVYVHDNKFIDQEELETMGIPVDVFNNESYVPTTEMSEKIFSSIFDVFNIEFSETGNIKQGSITAQNKEWVTEGNAKAYIYLAGYEGQITYDNVTYIPKPASECAIILTDTKNIATRPAGQTSELTLSDEENNTLKVTLKVKTNYKVKDYKTVSVGEHSIKVPYYKEHTEHKTFTKTFQVPEVYPVRGPEDINVTVTYQNNSYNPHTIVTVDGERTGTIFKYNGSEAREYRLIGYVDQASNGFKTTNFKNTHTWKFSDDSMSYSYQSLYIKGHFNPSLLQINVTTPYTEFPVTDFNYVEMGDPTDSKINPAPFVIIIILFIILRPLLQELSYNFGRLK